jgi:hypothetical protein
MSPRGDAEQNTAQAGQHGGELHRHKAVGGRSAPATHSGTVSAGISATVAACQGFIGRTVQPADASGSFQGG